MGSEKVNIDGINIAYVRRGKGIPLVLIHGYPLDRRIWNSVADNLESDYDLIIPDLRGFGESDFIEADSSIFNYASDLAGLLDHLGIRRAFLAGHSMGGYVALAFSRQFSQRVLGMALVSSQVISDTPERKEGRYAVARQVLTEGMMSVVEGMPSKLTSSIGIQAYTRTLISDQRPTAVATALHAIADRPDSTEMFKAIKFPVVIVHGQADALIPVERGREMKRDLPSAQYFELPDIGHMPMMEDVEAVAEALRVFQDVRTKGLRILDA